MEAADLGSGSRQEGSTRSQAAVLGVLLALAATAWLVTAERMQGMDAMPGMELGTLGFYLGIWVVMMAAMMLPAVAPTALAFDRLRPRATTDATAVFVAGYLLTWTAAGLTAYALFELVRAADPGFLAWDEAGRYIAGGAILLAAAYQLTPLKRAYLGSCRRPGEFLSARWREGRAGALELGARYGVWCLGCCWALMVALFAVGVMSVAWMAVIAALIAAERLLPWPVAARVGVAVVLVALGLGVAFVPADVPAFTEPSAAMGEGAGHGAPMEMMP